MMRKTLAHTCRVTFTAAALLLSAHSASADVIDYTGMYPGGGSYNATEMGALHLGQTGQLFNSYYTPPGSSSTGSNGYFNGSIPSLSSVLFTFTSPSITQVGDFDYAHMGASYNFSESGHTYTALSSMNTFGGQINTHSVDGTFYPGSYLLISAANLTGNTITASVTNYSTSTAFFGMHQILTLSGLTLVGNYTVTAVSAVPLPAALPMFASVLFGLFGFARRKRKAITA